MNNQRRLCAIGELPTTSNPG